MRSLFRNKKYRGKCHKCGKRRVLINYNLEFFTTDPEMDMWSGDDVCVSCLLGLLELNRLIKSWWD